MICKHCGKELEEGLTFCVFCGEPQEEGAKRPVPEQKNASLAAPLLVVLAFAIATAVCLWLFVFKGSEAPREGDAPPAQTETAAQVKADEIVIPRVVVDEEAYRTMAEDFAEAILLRDVDVITGNTHPLLQEAFAERFGNTNFVFSSCQVSASALRKIRRSEERSQEAALREEFGAELTLEDAYAVTVDFEAAYRGKTYGGEMMVVVADVRDDAGAVKHYVIQTVLTSIDEAFYEDNFDPGDHYFDTHSEE